MKKKTKTIYHIVIEGHDEKAMYALFEEIQNKYSFYDNCVLENCTPECTIIDKDRYEECGDLWIDEKIVKKYGDDI